MFDCFSARENKKFTKFYRPLSRFAQFAKLVGQRATTTTTTTATAMSNRQAQKI